MGIKRIIKKVLCRFVKPCIVFESYPNFVDNTRPIYDEFVKRGLNKKYNLFWFIDEETFAVLKNGSPEYWNRWDFSSLKNRLRDISLSNKVRATIFCNRFLVPNVFSNSKNSFYLGHGTPLKNSGGYYKTPNEIEFYLSSSEQMKKVIAYGHRCDIKKIVALGYPRNDAFYNNNTDVKRILNINCDKVIVWYPTFRQHKGGIRAGSNCSIPLIYNQDNATVLNDFLKSQNTFIVIKPHFAQDLGYIDPLSLSNIIFIDDSFYDEKKIQPYLFIGGCDALITDFSSIFFDFTLCNKPIGLIWEDLKEYLDKPGLNPDYENLTQGTVKIYSLNDLLLFIKNVVEGNDECVEKRNEMMKCFNIANDGKNTKRVADYIIKKANL